MPDKHLCLQRTSMLGRTQFGTTNFIDDLPRARPSGPFTLLPEWYRQSNAGTCAGPGAGPGPGDGGPWLRTADGAAPLAAGDAAAHGLGSPGGRGAGSSGGGGAQGGASVGSPRAGPAAIPAKTMQGSASGANGPSAQRQSPRPAAVAEPASVRPVAAAASPRVAASSHGGPASGVWGGEQPRGTPMQSSPASGSPGTPRRRPAALTSGAQSARGRVESGPINKALLSVLDCY
jgi:hypothetical protein